MIEYFANTVFEPIKDSVLKIGLGIALSVLAYALLAIKKLSSFAKKDSSISITYEQLNFMLSQRSDEIMILKSELEQLRKDKDSLFLKTTDQLQEMTLLKTKIFYLEKELEEAGGKVPESPSLVRGRLEALISRGSLERAISVFRGSSSDNELLDDLTQLSANLSLIGNERRAGTIDFETYEINRNQVSNSLIELINIHFK